MFYQIPKSIRVYLSAAESESILASAREAERLERTWKAKSIKFWRSVNEEAAKHIEAFETMDGFDFDMLQFLLDHQFDVLKHAIKTSESEKRRIKRMGRGGRSHLPKSLSELFALYEKWRHGEEIPNRVRSIAYKIKKLYIAKVQRVWKRHGEEFRDGHVYSRTKAVEAIREHTKMPRTRAEMTIQTETTRGYREGTRAVYDPMEEIWGYLFLAIRDSQTTRWCRTRQGMVLKKGTIALERNQCPCHWNCRSQLTPLTIYNPMHLKMIEDKSRWPENRRLEPLPPNWNKR